MRTKRQGLIVWFQHMKNIKQIKRHGHLVYVSKGLKYAVVYVDQKEIEEKEKKFNELPFISKVDYSYKPFINTNYESVKMEKEQEKTYDYKMGI